MDKTLRLTCISVFFLLTQLQVGGTQSGAENTNPYSELTAFKNGLLLVRLEDYDHAAAELRLRNREAEANQLQEKAAQLEADLIAAFSTEYSFSAVAFYKASDADAVIKDADFSKVFNARGQMLDADDAADVFICKYESLPFTAGSNVRVLQVFKLERGFIVPVNPPVPSFFRMPFFDRLRYKNDVRKKVAHMQSKLQKVEEKLLKK